MEHRRIRNPLLRAMRELIDIILVVAVNIGAAMWLFSVAADRADEFEPFIALAVPLLTLVFIWALLALRRQGWAEIGLKARVHWLSTLLQAALIAIGLFAVAWLTERAGLERNLDSLRAAASGGAGLLAYQMLYALVVVGFYEEITFRGLVMNRFAHMFGAGNGAWALAAILQGLLFGLAHLHQGVYGAVYTGVLSMLLAFIFLINGRNLWPLIIGHGLYDAARIFSFSLTAA